MIEWLCYPPNRVGLAFSKNLVFNGNLSQKGVQQLLSAIDNTIRFVDTKFMRNFGLKFTQIFQKDKLQTDAEGRMSSFEVQLQRAKENKQTRLIAARPARPPSRVWNNTNPTTSQGGGDEYRSTSSTSQGNNTRITGIVRPQQLPLQEIRNNQRRSGQQPCCRKKLFYHRDNF